MTGVNYSLKKFRIESKMTQQQLAVMLHVDRSTIAGWENGKREPDLDTLSELAEIFHVSLDELITGIKYDQKIRKQLKKKAYIRTVVIGLITLFIHVGLEMAMKATYNNGDYGLDYMNYSLIHTTLLYLFIPWLLMCVTTCFTTFSIQEKKMERLSFFLGIVFLIIYYVSLFLALENPISNFQVKVTLDYYQLILPIVGMLLFVGTFNIETLFKKDLRENALGHEIKKEKENK